MTIAFLIEKFEDKNFRGGGEKLNFKLISQLVKLGFDIDVFCNTSNTEKDYGIKNIRIFNLDKEAFFDEVLKIISSQKYDAVFSENLSAPCDICCIHGHTVKYRQETVRNSFERFLTKYLKPKRYKKNLEKAARQAYIAKNCKKILVPSTLHKDDVVKNLNIAQDKVFVLPPAIDAPQNTERQPNEVFTFGLSAIGFANKGGYTALKAFKKFNHNKKAKLRIIYPKWRKNLILRLFLLLNNLDKNVEFVDKYQNIGDFYKGIDCLLVPSKEETFGMVVTEAMSFGVPVIISSRCGAKDFVKEEQNGFVFDFENKAVENLARKMNEIIMKTSEEIKTLKANALKTIENLTWEDFANKFVTIYNQK